MTAKKEENMRLVTFADGQGQRLGVLQGDEIADVTAGSSLPKTIAEYCCN